MNQESKQTLTIRRAELEQLLRELRIFNPEVKQPVAINPGPVIGGKGAETGVSRLAYTMRETAEVLGLSRNTVYRLLKRGLLRSSGAVRRKIISRAEIERFLKDTSQSIF